MQEMQREINNQHVFLHFHKKEKYHFHYLNPCSRWSTSNANFSTTIPLLLTGAGSNCIRPFQVILPHLVLN